MGQNIQNWKTIEIHFVKLTEVCGKVLSEKYAYTSLLKFHYNRSYNRQILWEIVVLIYIKYPSVTYYQTTYQKYDWRGHKSPSVCGP